MKIYMIVYISYDLDLSIDVIHRSIKIKLIVIWWCTAPNLTHKKKKGSIQRTQTPPRLWPLTLSCDLDLKSRSKRLMSLDVIYCIVPWYPGMMSMGLILYEISPFVYFMWPLTLWPSAFVKFTCTLIIRCISIFMLLNHCTKTQVCRFSRKRNIAICMEKFEWRHYDVITLLIFMKFDYISPMCISMRHIKFQFDRT